MVFPGGGGDEAIRRQAAVWFQRMQGSPTGEVRAEFEQWRRSDPRHAAEYAKTEANWQAFGGLRKTSVGRSRNLESFRRREFAFAPRRYVLAGAMLLILLAFGFAWSVLRPSHVPQLATTGTRLSTAIGQIRRQALDDGSIVTLDTDSQIEVAYAPSYRIVRLLRGRARFDVAHNPDRPFVVEAAGQTVTARGTVFDVSLSRAGMAVALLRGAIDVARGSAGKPSEGPVRKLVAGQSLRPGAAEAGATARGEEQWVGGMLGFDGTPLSDVLDQTNRYSPVKITLADPALGKLKVTGAFQPLPVEELARALAATFSLRVDQTPKGDIVLRAR